MRRISGGQLSREAKATLLSSHAGGPRTAAGDKTFVGQTRHRSCTRYRTLKGGFNIHGHIGNNSFLFTGRLNGRKLRPGRYALAAAPRALHKTGQIQRVRFRIVAAPRAPR